MICIIPFADHEIGHWCVKYLLDLERAKKIKVPLIITTKNNSDNWWPSIHNIESKVIKIYEEIEPHDIKFQVDYFLFLSWKFYMTKKWIDLPKYSTINLHFSLLPKHRGTNPINWALIEGDKSTGVTFHQVNSNIDEGKIIRQKETNISVSDTLTTLLNKLNLLAFQEFKLLLKQIINNSLTCKE